MLIKGRISRSNFLIAYFVGVSLLALGFIGIAFQDSGFSLIATLVATFFIVFSLFLLITNTVKRLHDMDMNGWWSLLFIIPFISLFMIVICLVRKGATGINRFGPDPLELMNKNN